MLENHFTSEILVKNNNHLRKNKHCLYTLCLILSMQNRAKFVIVTR